MAWNSDDGVNRYTTDDGHTFNTEKDAEDHYRKLADDRARSEELAKYLAAVKGVCNEAWRLINNGDYNGAADHLHNNSTKTGEFSYRMPWQFFYPMGAAEEYLGSNNDAIECYSKYLETYREGGSVAENNSYNHALYSRARVYIKLGEWKKAMNDCESVIRSEDSFGSQRNEILGNAFYWRALSHEKLNNKKMAVWDYKISSDFGNKECADKLNNLGIRYRPKKPPRTLRGNPLLALIFAAVSLSAALLSTVLISIIANSGNSSISIPGGGWGLIVTLIIILAIIIIAYNHWRWTFYKLYPRAKKRIFLIVFSIMAISGLSITGMVLDILNIEAGAAIVVSNDGRMLDKPHWGDGEVITEIPKGTVLTVIEVVRDGGSSGEQMWLGVEYEGKKGYLDTSSITRKRGGKK